MDKTMYVDAISSIAIDMNYCIVFEQMGLLQFNGDGHNPSWRWNKKELETISIEDLKDLYQLVKELE